MITIYKYDGTVRAEVEPSADSYVNLQISDEHYADINFVSSAWIPFEVGDYVFLFGKYYQLLKVAAPVTKKSSVSFEYKLKFEDERQDMDDVNLMLFDNTTSDITPAYDPLHSYSKGDVVAYHTLYWECVSDTAIQGITPIEGNYWQLRSSVTHTVAEYDPTKTYTYGEEAIYNYCIFKHIGSVDTVGVHPEEGANWTQLTTAPQFDFSSVLTPHRWAQLFCDNMMRARPDQTWTVGYCIPDQPKEQAFSNVSVLSALASTADLYETEFYIEETAHRVFTINIGKKAITTSLTMKYGGDDAFSDIERNEVTDNKKVTRLVAMGGMKNILPTYRGGSKRLLLPDKMYLDSANIDPNHPLEGTHTWEDIYPSMMHATDDWDSTVPYAVGDMVVYNNTSWTCLVSNTNQAPAEGTYWQISEGTVTEFISEYKLIDKNLTFNPLDPTLIMSDGTIPKIHFITGNLAGYEFPIADFNKETKQITIQSIQDGNDSILPTAGYTFKAGDQFNIVDFYMPQSYITKAENYLAAKATEWLQKYSVDQITYKGSVNRVWSAQNQIEIVEGDLIQVVDTDFGINIQYRITQVKRYIRENYRYEIVLDNTPYVPSKIQSIINSTEKSSTYLQYSNLETQMAKTRTYKGASEAIDMAFDPESKYFTSGIAPLFVKTAMALFGTETQQYTLTGIKVSTSEGTPNIVSWGTGTITDTTQQSSARTWNIPSGSFTATDNDTSYYAYIRCNTESGSTVAEMIFTEKQYKLNADSAYYYFLLGSLTKLTGSIRQFFTSSGFTFISGDSIVTGIIRSADGNTYFDLSGSHLHIGNSDKYIDYQNGEVKQKGIINVSQSGAESVIGVFRGAYQTNTMYYEGDTVTYGGSTWRYINTTAAQNVTPVEGSNWTNVSAAGKGISSTVITYQVSDSGTTIPTGDWLSSIPSVSAGNYLWTRTVITYTDSTDSTSYSVAMTGATGATGKGISSTAITYQKSGSGTTAPTGTWLTSIPSVPAGSYLWTRTVITYTDGQTSTGYTVSYQSTNGVNSYFHTAYSTAADGSTGFSTTDPTGKTYIGTYSDSNEADSTDPTKYTWVLIKGETGAAGATGNGISSYSVTYQKSASGTDIPTGSWTTSIPSLAAGEYLWTKTTLVFADSASTSAYSVSMKGETGEAGATGATGKGISSTAITYQKSGSGTTAPTGTWLTSIPSVPAGSYLWTRTVITYTDGQTSTIYSVSKMGDTGSTGAAGAAGQTGNYFEHRYAVNGSNSTPPSLDTSSVSPSGWTTSLPTQGLLEYTWMTTAEKTSAGALVGTWSTPIRVTGIKGDTGDSGATGPSMSFSGDWSASNTYTGSSIIVQVVKYSGTYYITRSDAGGSFSSSTTPNNDTAHWNVYGSSFDNIATGLLLAQEAYIDNLIVSKLATSANPYHMLLAILDSSLGIFRNKADSASIGNAMVAIGKDISEMQLSGQRKPAIAVRDVQWRGDYDGSTIYYKDDRVYYATNNTTYLFTHDWLATETPAAGLLPTNYNYWEPIGSGNLGGGKYSELGSEGIFSNGSNVQGLPFLGTYDNFTLAALLHKRNADSYGISAAVLGVDETHDSDAINASKSYGGYFNRLYIQSELDNIFVTSDSADLTLDKSGYHTIHYYGTSDKNVYLPAVNSRDVGLKFWFRKMNSAKIIVHADSGHSIINQNGDSVVIVGVEYNSLCMVIWDGSYWIFNFMN